MVGYSSNRTTTWERRPVGWPSTVRGWNRISRTISSVEAAAGGRGHGGPGDTAAAVGLEQDRHVAFDAAWGGPPRVVGLTQAAADHVGVGQAQKVEAGQEGNGALAALRPDGDRGRGRVLRARRRRRRSRPGLCQITGQPVALGSQRLALRPGVGQWFEKRLTLGECVGIVRPDGARRPGAKLLEGLALHGERLAVAVAELAVAAQRLLLRDESRRPIRQVRGTE